MQLGVMQPYFLPYLGYFQLMHHCDAWVVFDDIQYIRHGWINRNRILHPKQGWQYISVPLKKHSRGTSIRDIRISAQGDWKRRILAQLQHYKKRAPHFSAVTHLLENTLDAQETRIWRLNLTLLRAVCRVLEIDIPIHIFSELDIDRDPIRDAGDWALEIARHLGAEAYINPPGGRELFSAAKFDAAGIALRFLESELLPYPQRREAFEPGLSIVDVLMFNSPEDVKKRLLTAYRVEP